jgi:23S rRNA pseudouridine2605 synthase
MSTTPDDDAVPLANPATEPEAKPTRRRRAVPAAEAAAKPRRRRAAAAAASEPSQAGAAEPASGDGAQLRAAAQVEPVVAAPEAAEPAPSDAEGPDRSAHAQTDGGAPEPAAGEEASRPGGGRRRNRRDRRRRERGEGPEAGTRGGEPGERAAEAAPGAAPADAGERFAEVLSGAFDATAEASAEAEAAPKRILAPEPEAPKLHKVLAQAGIGSRRDMEAMILEGRITVNGQPAHIGQRISWGDQIKVGGKPVKVRIQPPPPRIVAYHKPVGEIVTHDDPQNRPTVFRRLPRLAQGKWQSVGRLDINTEGLLLFTNSGELANQLMHPRFGVEREYAARVLGTLDDESRARLLEGVEIEGQRAAFKSIVDGGGDGANRWYRVVIAEGRNREVRKLFDAVGLAVNRLIRIRYGTVVLPHGLKRGMWVDLGEDDVRAIRRLAGGGAARDERGTQAGDKRKQRGGRGPDRPREARPTEPAAPPERRGEEAHIETEEEFEDHHGPIPNPLEQTFDKRFVQKPRSPAGGRGFGRGGGGFGPGGSAPSGGAAKPGKGPRQPDPMQTSVGYIGADALHRKRGRGGRGGGFGGGFGGGGR